MFSDVEAHGCAPLHQENQNQIIMKKIIATIAIAIMFLGVQAQDNPPHPNGDANPTLPGSGNSPVGGGAPIAGGIGILLALGAAYGSKKFYQKTKTANKTE